MKNVLKKRLALKFPQEMRMETRISNFKLKWDLIRKILFFGGGWEGDLGGYVPHYIPEGVYVPHYIPESVFFH